MRLVDLDADKSYLLDGRYKVSNLLKCKDCKHWRTKDDDLNDDYCAYWYTDENCYCIEAEEKQEEK